MQLMSIHLVDIAAAEAFIAAVLGDPPADATGQRRAWIEGAVASGRRGLSSAATGDETGANAVSLALAQVLATVQPSFVQPGVSLSTIEAIVDRGVGMLLRPPSRLVTELGLPVPVARAMPIRLDATSAMMGGAYMPAALVPQFRDHLVARDTRFVRRLHDAGYDAVATYGLLLEMATLATDRGLGLLEAVDAVIADAGAPNPPGADIRVADVKRMDPAEVRRLTESLKPPKRSLMDRLTGRTARTDAIQPDGT